MEDNKVRPTSVHIPIELLQKADRLASVRGISRNKLINLLIESAREVSVPPVEVNLPEVEKDKVPA